MLRHLLFEKRRFLLLGCGVLVLFLTCFVPIKSASALDIPPQCAGDWQQVQATETILTELSNEINSENSAEKSVTTKQIEAESNILAKQEQTFQSCLNANPGLPVLNTTLTGTALLVTSYDEYQAHNAPVTINLQFSTYRDQVVFALQPVNPTGVPLTVTQTDQTSSTFDKTTGDMTIGVSLHFAINKALAPSSDATFLFTTGNSVSPDKVINITGTPLNRQTGEITLVGTSQFQGGVLNGNDVAIAITGTLAQLP